MQKQKEQDCQRKSKMDDQTLDKIKVECERIEQASGYGQVAIIIMDGKVHHIKPEMSIFIQPLDKCSKVC